MPRVAELPHEKFMRSKNVSLPTELQEIDEKLKEAKKVDYASAKEVSLELVEILKNIVYSLHVEMEAIKENIANHEERIEVLESKVQEQTVVDTEQTSAIAEISLNQDNQETQDEPLQEQEPAQETKQEPEYEPEPEPDIYTSKHEELLAKLYDEGTRYISRHELYEMGFYKNRLFGPGLYGKTYGRYALRKRFSDRIYTIVKLY